MIPDRIGYLYSQSTTDNPFFPPTDLFSEGWMLRLVLDWLHQNRSHQFDCCLPYTEDSYWYSEALLPSAFLERRRRDPLAESHTHADGVIGHFTIGSSRKGDFELQSDATAFVVLEAKIFSKLSERVTNADFYNQAARNVACMAEIVHRAQIPIDQLRTVAFYVVAPESQIEGGVFSDFVTHDSIVAVVKRRVDQYEGEKDGWYESSFLPFMEIVDLGLISWEAIVKDIQKSDREFGTELQEFYTNCLRYNGPSSK